MALDRKSIPEREYHKFVESPSRPGEPAIEVVVAGLDIPEVNTVPDGLGIGGVTTEVSLNSSSWVALPVTPMTNRKGITIQNRSGSEMKVNFSQPVGYVGISVPNNAERFYDIKDTIVIYGKLLSGTGNVTIEEIG